MDYAVERIRRTGKGAFLNLRYQLMAIVRVENIGIGPFGEFRFIPLFLHEESREIETGLRVCVFQELRASDSLVERAQSEFGEMFARLLREKAEEVDDMGGASREELALLDTLGRDADGAGVAVASTVLNAAESDKQSGSESEFFGAEQGCDHDIAACFELSVDLHLDAPSEPVLDKRLLGFGKSKFPGEPGVLRGSEGGRARSAVEAGDENDVRVGLGDACGDRADTGFRNELDADAGFRVRAAEVVDQLGEVFDRVDVVVWRRRNQGHAGSCVTEPGDEIVHLVRRELSAFAGFRALGQLYLQIPGAAEVVKRYAESTGGDLFDAAVGVCAETFAVESAFSRIGHRTYRVERQRDRLVRFRREGSEGHRSADETFHDRFGWFNLRNVDRRGLGEGE